MAGRVSFPLCGERPAIDAFGTAGTGDDAVVAKAAVMDFHGLIAVYFDNDVKLDAAAFYFALDAVPAGHIADVARGGIPSLPEVWLP